MTWSDGMTRQASVSRRTIRRGYADSAGGQIHFHEVPGDGPAIVFLHQTALSAKSYDPLLRALDLSNRLVALDTPGFGGSYDPEGWPTLEAYADGLIEAVDALGERRFHLYGHHTGASLAIEIAARVPDRVASLILSGPVFMTEPERQSFIAGYRDPIAPEREGGHLMRNWDYTAVHNPGCDLDIVQEATADLLRAWRSRPQPYMAVARHDTAERARRLSLPVLLMTTPGDFFHGSFDRAIALFPAASTAETEGDNLPTSIDPEGVAREVARFLASHPG